MTDNRNTNTNGDMSTMWGEQSAVGADGPKGSWFTESKFAMFIHWGLYSEAAGVWDGKTYYGIAEWLMSIAKIPIAEYEKLAARFNPVEFDADEWVGLAKAAGMKYLVITAKHHDGFATFKSQACAYNIMDATPFGRDPLAELAEACRKQGLRLGFYYSQWQDWHEADAAGNTWDFAQPGDFDRYLRAKALPQIEELLTNYGPIALIWFDTPGTISAEASQELLDLVRRLQPECLVNSRLGNGLGDYVTLGDQEVPLTAPDTMWESVDTHNDTWAYALSDQNWKSAAELVSRLARTVALGGNYMLNVGPTGKGIIPAQSAAILREVGEWVQRNAESLYGTRRSPVPLQAWGCCTAAPGKLFLQVLHWPTSGVLWLPNLQAEVTGARFLVTGEAVPFAREGDHLRLDIPQLPPDALATVIELEIAGTVEAGAVEVFLHEGLTNEFHAPFANLEGLQHAKRSWMEKFGDWHHCDVVEGWQTGSAASWDVTALAPGSYYLWISYECLPEADGSEFAVSLGETRWTFPVQATTGAATGRTRLREECLGLVTLPEAGRYALKLRALEIKGDGFVVEKLTLRA
ncbi:MAG: alpha-L-fucosidase [Armatimonadota bacterium]